MGRYQARYGLVLVTTLREFQLVGADAKGRTTTLESFELEQQPNVHFVHGGGKSRLAPLSRGVTLEVYGICLSVKAMVDTMGRFAIRSSPAPPNIRPNDPCSAAHTPRSVTSPVTSRLGVTSKA